MAAKDKNNWDELASILQSHIDDGRTVSTKTAKHLLGILYQQQLKEDEHLRSLHELMYLYLKTRVYVYFEDKPDYWFNIKISSRRYSLAVWLELLFDKLKSAQSLPRTEFINYVANDLFRYSEGMKKRSLSKYRVFVITGYIASLFGHCYSEEQFPSLQYNYRNYHSYLFDIVKGVYK